MTPEMLLEALKQFQMQMAQDAALREDAIRQREEEIELAEAHMAAMEKETAEREKAAQKTKQANQQVADALINTGKAFLDIAKAGRELAATMGTSITRGVQLEVDNRKSLFKQIFTLDTNSILSKKQLESAESSLASVMMGAREGYQISAEGTAEFGKSLKRGFGAEFELTGESMRSLVTAGVSTEQGFESLRKASGRASLSNTQLATLVNKNSLSFMLYGPRFAKAAQQAERLGISLSQVQSAQESMVTNLDGTIDTIAQINQLGGQIDFGTLTQINEFQGPEATLKYLQSTIPPALFQSASTRALLKGFGISVEDLMKRQGSVQDQAASNIEKSLTKLETPIGIISRTLAFFETRITALMDSFGTLIKVLIGTVITLVVFRNLISTMGIIGGLLTSAFPALKESALITRMMTGGAAATTATGAAGAGAAAAGGAGAAGGAVGVGGFLKGLASGLRAIATPQALVGLAAITLAIIGLAYALKIAAPGIIAFGQAAKSVLEGIGTIITSIGTALGTIITSVGDALSKVFTSLKEMNPVQLMALSAPLLSLGFALMGLGVAAIGGSIGLGIASLTIGKLANSSNGIQLLATNMRNLKDSIVELNSVDLSKLKEITDAATPSMSTILKAGLAKALGITTTAPTVPTATVAAAAGTPVVPNSNADLIRKVDELITVLKNAKTVINIDNKIEEVPRPSLVGVYTRNERRA